MRTLARGPGKRMREVRACGAAPEPTGFEEKPVSLQSSSGCGRRRGVGSFVSDYGKEVRGHAGGNYSCCPWTPAWLSRAVRDLRGEEQETAVGTGRERAELLESELGGI